MTFNYKSGPFTLFILKEKRFRKSIFIRRQREESFKGKILWKVKQHSLTQLTRLEAVSYTSTYNLKCFRE